MSVQEYRHGKVTFTSNYDNAKTALQMQIRELREEVYKSKRGIRAVEKQIEALELAELPELERRERSNYIPIYKKYTYVVKIGKEKTENLNLTRGGKNKFGKVEKKP